jgi:Amt family ammonium transporter
MKINTRNLGWALGAVALMSSVPAMAQEAAAASPVSGADVAWLLTSAALVLLMTPGLAFFYAGMVRGKNVVSTIAQSFAAMSLISIVWYLFGYSLAFSPGSSLLGGFDWALFNGVGSAPNTDYAATIPHVLFAVYQCMFAIITPALIAGAFAERMKFSAYAAFIVLWSIVVYSPVAHWVWGVGGLLRGWGILDFAGGLVVHQTAGFSALAAALAIGKRSDYGKANYSASSVPLITIGTGLLWFGWFGFNGGSALGSGELAVTAFSSTHFAAAAAGLGWAIMDKLLKGKVSLVGICIGIVVGLVAVTPAAGFVSAGSGLLIGLIGAVAANLVAHFRAKSQLDDSLDVFACHGVGGLVGSVLTGVFCSKAVNAAGADGGAAQFFIQLKSSLVVGVFSFVATFVLFKIIQVVIGLRPTVAEETSGLDEVDHGEKAYT